MASRSGLVSLDITIVPTQTWDDRTRTKAYLDAMALLASALNAPQLHLSGSSFWINWERVGEHCVAGKIRATPPLGTIPAPSSSK